jgi:hypothetical protein
MHEANFVFTDSNKNEYGKPESERMIWECPMESTGREMR